MINEILSIDSFYFSYSADFTTSVQHAQQPHLQVPLWQQADPRFFWNLHLQQKLIDVASSDATFSPISRFILPVFCGFIHWSIHHYEESKFDYYIISRRSRHRAGFFLIIFKGLDIIREGLTVKGMSRIL
jgi:hypothetical protein